MIIHLGGDVIIPMEDIVAIIDVETAKNCKDTRQYLERLKDDNKVTVIEGEENKSYILVKQNGQHRVYVSPISSATLLKRSHFMGEIRL